MMQKIVFIPSQTAPWYCVGSRRVDAADTIGSSLMRAVVPAAFMKKHYSDKIDVRYGRNIPDDLAPGDIVVFVRTFLHEDIRKAREMGCITVYDAVDDCDPFPGDPLYSVMIATSRRHQELMARRHDLDIRRIVDIDVLHTNVQREKTSVLRPGQRQVVGSVNPGNTAFLRNDLYEDLVSFSRRNDFELRNVNFNVQRIGFDANNLSVNNLIKCYEGIHIGLALYNQDDLDYDRVNQKPSTKVSGYASYDIPVVCTYQKSFDPILKAFPAFQDYVVEDVRTAKDIIQRLVKDYDYYMKSRSLFHDIGEMFHMDHSYEKYVTQINEAAKFDSKVSR